jgi:hypothetical protein
VVDMRDNAEVSDQGLVHKFSITVESIPVR